jgi:hypothetical protein
VEYEIEDAEKHGVGIRHNVTAEILTLTVNKECKIKDMAKIVLLILYKQLNEKSNSLYLDNITLSFLAERSGFTPENASMCLWYLKGKKFITCKDISYKDYCNDPESFLNGLRLMPEGIDFIEND